MGARGAYALAGVNRTANARARGRDPRRRTPGLRAAVGLETRASLAADLEAGKPLDRDRRADFLRQLLRHLLDGLRVVVDPRLVDQDASLEVRLHLPLDDLVDDL